MLLFFLLVLSFFRGLSIISLVIYFFVQAYPFKNIRQIEIFIIVYLPQELLSRYFVSLCKVSKTLKIFKKHVFDIKCCFYIVILKRVLFRRKFHPGHSLLLFPHSHSILLTTKNKLNLQNYRILEWHKERLS